MRDSEVVSVQTKVKIKNLRIETVIGICEWEQYAEQPLIFNLDMELNQCDAIQTDHIDDALDYASVANDIETLVKDSRVKLLEALLGEIVAALMERYPQIERLTLSVDKPQAIPAADAACVEVVADRGDGFRGQATE